MDNLIHFSKLENELRTIGDDAYPLVIVYYDHTCVFFESYTHVEATFDSGKFKYLSGWIRSISPLK